MRSAWLRSAAKDEDHMVNEHSVAERSVEKRSGASTIEEMWSMALRSSSAEEPKSVELEKRSVEESGRSRRNVA